MEKEVAALRTDLADIERFLDECERSGSKKALADAALRMKTVAPRLKGLRGDPSTLAPELLQHISELNSGFKAAFQRAKALKETTDHPKPAAAATAPTSAEPVPAPQPAPTVETTPPPAPKQQRETEQAAPPSSTTETVPDAAALEAERKAKEAADAKEREREAERQRKRELEHAIASESEKKRAADSEARAAVDKKERREQLAAQARQVVAVTAEDEGESDAQHGGSTSLALPGMREGHPGKDIWAMLQRLRSEQQPQQQQQADEEHTVIFVGGKSSGKSTLLAGFLDKHAEKEESTALEYSFGRRTRGSTMAREVVHCWEIAGGTRLASLLEVCLTPEHVDSTAVVLVVDLSEPAKMMDVLTVWLEAVRSQVDQCLRTLSKLNPSKREAMSKAATAGMPAEHADRATVRPLGVPVLLVGTKYDQFQDLEAEQRKVISRTLRYVAHANGMALLYVVARREEGKHMTRFRAHLNHLLFGMPIPEAPVTAYTKPLVVPRWQDTFDSIGKPSAAGGASSMQAWRDMFERVFPQQRTEPEEEEAARNAHEEEADRFAEPAVDAAVAEKGHEFDRNAQLLAAAALLRGAR